MTINTPNNSNGFQDGVILAPEVREGFGVSKSGDFQLPLGKDWFISEDFISGSTIWFPITDESINTGVIPEGMKKQIDEKTFITLHMLGYENSWEHAIQYLQQLSSLDNNVKINLAYERRYYANKGNKHVDLGYYLTGVKKDSGDSKRNTDALNEKVVGTVNASLIGDSPGDQSKD